MKAVTTTSSYPTTRWEWEQRFRESRLSTRAIVTGLTMATYASADGTSVRPSIDRLAANTGQSRSTVDRAVRELKRWGWVETVRQGGRGGKDGALATEYRLTVGRARTTRGQVARLRELFVDRYGGDDVAVLDEPAHGLPVGSMLIGSGDASHHVTGDVVRHTVTTSFQDVTTSSERVTTSYEAGHHVTGDVLPVQDHYIPPEQEDQNTIDVWAEAERLAAAEPAENESVEHEDHVEPEVPGAPEEDDEFDVWDRGWLEDQGLL